MYNMLASSGRCLAQKVCSRAAVESRVAWGSGGGSNRHEKDRGVCGNRGVRGNRAGEEVYMGAELGRRDDFLERSTGMWSHDASIGVYTTRLQLPGINNGHYSLSC